MIQHACLHHSSANMRIRPAVHACITPCQTTEATNRYQAICNTWFYGSPRFGETIKLTPAEANLLIWQKIKWGSWKQNPFFFLMKGSSFKTRWWGPAKSLLPEEKKKKKKEAWTTGKSTLPNRNMSITLLQILILKGFCF